MNRKPQQCQENYKTHTILQPADCKCGGSRICPICDGGLAFCTVCKGGEIELDEQTCEDRLREQERECLQRRGYAATLLSAELFPHFGDVRCAVFNCNEYGKRKGREAVKAKYGNRGWKEVKKRMKSGIMEIFNHKPTKETALFANVVGLAAEKRFASE